MSLVLKLSLSLNSLLNIFLKSLLTISYLRFKKYIRYSRIDNSDIIRTQFGHSQSIVGTFCLSMFLNDFIINQFT